MGSDDGKLRLTMTVKKSADNQTAELDVADQGTGLPESQRARVMRPFERGESARSGVTGSGLGLAIVDRIVRRSGGTVVRGDALPHGPLIQRSTLKKALKEQDKAALKLEKEEEKSQEALPQSSEQTNGQTPQETAQSAGSLSSSESIAAQHEPSSSDKNQQS